MTEVYKKKRTQLDDDLRRNAMSQRESAEKKEVDRAAIAKEYMPKELMTEVGKLLFEFKGANINLLAVYHEPTVEAIQDYLDALIKMSYALRRHMQNAASIRQYIKDDLGE